MVSRSQKRRAGELLMLSAFLLVISLLLPVLNPLAVPISILLEVLGIDPLLAIPVTGLTGFLLFLLGAELYIRNRIHWHEKAES